MRLEIDYMKLIHYLMFMCSSAGLHAQYRIKDFKIAESAIASLSKGNYEYGKNAPTMGALTKWKISLYSNGVGIENPIDAKSINSIFKRTKENVTRLYGKPYLVNSETSETLWKVVVYKIVDPLNKVSFLIIEKRIGNDTYSFHFYTAEKIPEYILKRVNGQAKPK